MGHRIVVDRPKTDLGLKLPTAIALVAPRVRSEEKADWETGDREKPDRAGDLEKEDPEKEDPGKEDPGKAGPQKGDLEERDLGTMRVLKAGPALADCAAVTRQVLKRSRNRQSPSCLPMLRTNVPYPSRLYPRLGYLGRLAVPKEMNE